ncbi:MAG: tRNA pseudouridine(55) synthase TruB [Firmicutes bacterium]|nr:tRNA pseudouridine(55) synthase TruB [Bacillota bacterium]MCL5015848.1 tRNA pseudouridine(55) synthase TruB [Bacillota bacterium]
MLNGFLNLYKPLGMSSHQAVSKIRMMTGQKQVGHAGTLDPMAEGVLPIAMGSYTRLLEWTNLVPKVYHAHMTLGTQTHSGDREGYVVAESGAPFPNVDQIATVLRWFRGEILQFPPQVSALKQGGRRAYDLVRHGRTPWLAPRHTVVEDIRLTGGQNRCWSLELTVGSGTYIRAIVRDMGFILGHAASLQSLLRVRVGSFTLENAHRLDQLNQHTDWKRLLLTRPSLLTIPAVAVTGRAIPDLVHGKISAIPHIEGESGVVSLSCDNVVVAVVEGPPWRFRKVIGKE